MRSYLERIAAAALAPGGSFHPIVGSVYARPGNGPEALEAAPHAGKWPSPMVSDGDAVDEEAQARPEGRRVVRVSQRTSAAGNPALSAAIDLPPVGAEPEISLESSSDFSTEASTRERHVSSAFVRDESVAGGYAREQEVVDDRGVYPVAASLAAPLSMPAASMRRAEATESVSDDDRQAASVPAGTRTPRGTFVRRAGSVEEAAAEAGPAMWPSSATEKSGTAPQPRTGRALLGGVSGEARQMLSDVLAAASEWPSPDPRLSAASGSTPRAPERQPPSADSAYKPLVGGRSSASGPLQAGSAAFQTAPQAAASRDAAARERARVQAQQREPDEIQIHIGRIEVTAASPQPAARSQPTAIRKTPSLDDYLRRGNGRA